jgi:hypothetical protein
MLSSPSHPAVLVSLLLSLTSLVSLSAIRRGSTLHLPLIRREIITSTPRWIPKQGAIGLGDYIDVCVSADLLPRLVHRRIRTYNVLVQVGETFAPLVLGMLCNSPTPYTP